MHSSSASCSDTLDTLRLHEEMLTDEGRRIAPEHTRLMHEYLEALREDLGADWPSPQGPGEAPRPRGNSAWAARRAPMAARMPRAS